MDPVGIANTKHPSESPPLAPSEDPPVERNTVPPPAPADAAGVASTWHLLDVAAKPDRSIVATTMP